MIDETKTEIGLIQIEMQRRADDHADWAEQNWRDAIPAVTVELAEIIFFFGDHLTPEKRNGIISFGAALVRADAELTKLGFDRGEAGGMARLRDLLKG